ncbi:MAG: hypothetical protein BM556_16340 [Bacteriovorax sp. MedPE-SWde]|nr:MAG: hypothetical protein BM556_16340 [Bacteriovorax sp. MedPE-SWde]
MDNKENRDSGGNKPAASGGSSNRRRRPQNRNNRPKKKASASQGQNNSEKKAGPNSGNRQNNNPNKKKKRYSNNKRRGNNKVQKLTGIDYITTKYLNLLDQHIQARKKYFENFSRVKGQALAKLERNFIESQKAFLVFKERLSTTDQELFEKRYNSLGDDETYSKNHELPQGPVEISLGEEDIIDPHYLQSQIQANYEEDSEESSGSYDDYKAYKGIV